MRLRTLLILSVVAVLAAPVLAGMPVLVTINGEVEFNGIRTAPLNSVQSGDPVQMTFLVDSDMFMDNPRFPTRGYPINQMSFMYMLGGVETRLIDPYPTDQTPYFVIRNNDPGVDGFFLSEGLDFDSPLPLNQPGRFGPFGDAFAVSYPQDRLPSLDILDAFGYYDYIGLSSFYFAITDGPFEAMYIAYVDMTIELDDDDGDGVPNRDDRCPDTVIPESVPTLRLGVNHWALTDGDGVFDTTAPEGKGPGFYFDVFDTAGCSCEQIIAATGVGEGHVKFGCSNSVMEEWVMMVWGVDYRPDPGTAPTLGQPITGGDGNRVNRFQVKDPAPPADSGERGSTRRPRL